jgi:hypothetical protein
MTPKAQRIAIAEACGATWASVPPKPDNGFSSEYHPKRLLTFNPDDLRILPLADPRNHDSILVPDYLNDLNAMHEVVSIFDYDQADEFDDHLCDICKRANDLADNPTPWRFAVTNATAAQRAEAFLKTLCLWKDEA